MKELLVQYVFPGLVTFLLALGAYFMKRFTGWITTKAAMNDAEKEAMQCLLEGMAVSQETIVRVAKAAASDGKLTNAEMKEAGDVAIAFAKGVATGPAKDIIIAWSSSRVTSLIKQLLSKLKGGKKHVNPVIDPGTPA